MLSVLPLLSIVVPCYNSQSTIMRLIESLRRQTLSSGWDVTFIDDHSIDHTVDAIISQIKPGTFQHADPRFRILRNPSKGAGSARNLGLEKSSGKYLWFIDSDDYVLDPRAFETIFKAISENPDVDLFTINCAAVDGRGLKIEKSFTNLRAKPDLYGKMLSGSIDFAENFNVLYSVIGFPPWNKIVRRKFLEDSGIRFQNTLFCNDQYFSIRCMVEAQKLFLIPGSPLYCWSNAGHFHTSSPSFKKQHPEQYDIVLKGLESGCKWPSDDIRDKVLKDRREQFNRQ